MAGRAARIAATLEARGMLLLGTTAVSLPTALHEASDGLTAGDDEHFSEALDAYIQVCSSEQCDKSVTMRWQRHSRAPFAEALMDLVAVYRTMQTHAESGESSPAETAGNAAEALFADARAGLESSASKPPLTQSETVTVNKPRLSDESMEYASEAQQGTQQASQQQLAQELVQALTTVATPRSSSFGRSRGSKLSKISRSLSWNTRRLAEEGETPSGTTPLPATPGPPSPRHQKYRPAFTSRFEEANSHRSWSFNRRRGRARGAAEEAATPDGSVKVYFLDGSHKVFDALAETTASELVDQIKQRLGVSSSNAFALFQVAPPRP